MTNEQQTQTLNRSDTSPKRSGSCISKFQMDTSRLVQEGKFHQDTGQLGLVIRALEGLCIENTCPAGENPVQIINFKGKWLLMSKTVIIVAKCFQKSFP